MASNNPFKTNRTAASVPRPKPYSDPKPVVRRPPPRRPRRDHPWRPAKPKVRVRPKFPGHGPYKRPPFGKLIPAPASVAVRKAVMNRVIGKFIPFVGWVLLAYDIWEVMQAWRNTNAVGNTGTFVCAVQPPVPPYSGRIAGYDWGSSNTSFCGSQAPHGANNYAPGTPWLKEWMDHSTQNIWRGTRSWFYPSKPAYLDFPGFKWGPMYDYGIPLPHWFEPAWPFMPEPYPLAPPIRPGARPIPRTDPDPKPVPRPAPRLSLPPGVIPAVTIGGTSNNDRAKQGPDFHIKRRPKRRKEKERKKRLSTKLSAEWLELLKRTGARYTEMDDFISALYKGLDWKLRRWRGEDGVWRDRDHTTVGRAARIAALLGEINIQKAIHEIVKNEASDRAFAKVGQALADRAEKMGYWRGGAGFQAGGSNKRNLMWEAQKKAQQEKFAREYRNQFYAVRVLKDGEWVTEYRLRPKTQIPWLRKQSNFLKLDLPDLGKWWDMSYPEKLAYIDAISKYQALTPDQRTALLTGRLDPKSVGVPLRRGHYYGR